MIKTTFKNSIIKQFRDSFGTNSETENYMFIGRVLPWENENSPPVYTDTILNETDARNNIIVLKKLFSDNVAFCVRRINWEYGKTYSKFDNSVELYSDTNNVNFYVINSENNVYKCLNNNNGGISTISPTGTEIETITLSDGYQWKYLYSIPEQLANFITDEYIPIEFLDKIIYDINDPRVFQLAAELEAKENGKGRITAVEILQAGGSFPFSVEYDPNIIPYIPEEQHYVQSFVSLTDEDYIYLNLETGDLNRQDNFYSSNYVIYFCKGPGSGQVRTIDSYDGKTGKITLTEKLNIAVTSDTMYKILPKIEVIGDGYSALLIPQININTNLIEKVMVLSGGYGYSKIQLNVKTVKVGSENQTILRPIFSPYYGHSSNAFKELGCKNLMIRTEFGYNDKNLNFYNEYRQIGIIQNPTIRNRNKQVNKVVLDIEATSAVQELNLSVCTKCTQAITNTGSVFNPTNVSKLIGSTLVQGISGTNTYAVGIVKSWDSVSKVLTVYSIEGKFVLQSTSQINLYIKDYPIIGIVPLSSSVAITSVKEKNYFTSTTYTPNSKVISGTSYSLGTVDSWTVHDDRLSGELVLRDVKGSFIQSYYDLNGNFNKGENIVQFFMSTTDPKILVPSLNVSTIKTILPKSINQEEEIYTGTTKIQVTRSAGTSTPFTMKTFIPDSIIRQINSSGEIIAQGIIVDWNLNTATDPTNTTGTLLVNTTSGNFISSTNKNIYQYDGEIYVNIENTIICEVTESDVDVGTGDIIYTKNIVKIGHGQDSIEEIKLVLGF